MIKTKGKEATKPTISLLDCIKHFVPSFWDLETDTIIWSNRCKCGSRVDEKHQCLALKKKRDKNGAN
jgi:hypothetical protein